MSQTRSSQILSINSVTLSLIVLIQVLGVSYFVLHFHTQQYLPSPFVYDKSNTFMDLFNPLYWANNEGRFDIWKSIYPPLNFIILKIISFIFNEESRIINAFAMRGEGQAIILFYSMIFFIFPVFLVTSAKWEKVVKNKYQALLWYLIIITNAPLLFMFERGNLILLCFTSLPLLLSEFWLLRIVAMSILVNIKTYFVGVAIVLIIKKNY